MEVVVASINAQDRKAASRANGHGASRESILDRHFLDGSGRSNSIQDSSEKVAEGFAQTAAWLALEHRRLGGRNYKVEGRHPLSDLV